MCAALRGLAVAGLTASCVRGKVLYRAHFQLFPCMIYYAMEKKQKPLDSELRISVEPDAIVWIPRLEGNKNKVESDGRAPTCGVSKVSCPFWCQKWLITRTERAKNRAV